MSVERKEPTLSGFSAAQDDSVVSPEAGRPASKSEPSVREPSVRERESHSKGRSSGATSAGPVRESRTVEPKAATGSKAQRPRPAPVSSQQPKSGSGLTALALVLALGGLGLAGYAQWQLMQTQQQLLAADQRIAGLEQKLTLTDDEATQSVTALQANLKEARDSLELAHGEIRKLWDTRNVNRKGIADNEAALAEVKKTANSASGAAKSAASAAAEAKKLAQAQEGNWKTLRSDVALQTEQLSMVTDQADGQQKRLRELVDKANQLDSQMKQLQGDLAKRVKSNEEAIQAIDAYRRSVNRDILDIKRQLNPNS